MHNTKWFTLVELIIWVSLTILLMTSVMYFVASWMKNISVQKTFLDNTSQETAFFEGLTALFSNAQKQHFSEYASGALFKIQPYFKEWGFAYLWEKYTTGTYCQSGSLTSQTKHMEIYSFVPFEGRWWDIFSAISTQSWSITTSYFSWTTDVGGVFISGIDWATSIAPFQDELYIADTLGNKVVSIDVTQPQLPPKTIVGKGVSWSQFPVNATWKQVFLNSPTWLAYGEGFLFISDTLNDRVLAYDTTTQEISILLWRSVWLQEPTWLYYDDAQKALYIANSGKWEILKFSSSVVSSIPDLTLSFSPGNDISWVDNFALDFFTSGSGVTGDFSFSWFISSASDYHTGSTDRVDYYFSDFATLEYDSGIIGISNCNTRTDYYLENGVLKKQDIVCIDTGTGSILLYQGTQNTNLIAWNTYAIQLQNIVWDFLNTTQTYYVKLSLFDADNLLWSKYFPFFTFSDGLVSTQDDNTLEVYVSGLEYPTGIFPVGANIAVNEFLTRKQKIFNTNGVQIASSDLQGFDFSVIDKKSKNTLYSPLKNLEFQRTGDLLTMKLEYYKNFDCNEEESLNVEREMIFKKYLK